MNEEEDRIRTIAGYLLKNNARLILSAPVEVAEFVKQAVLTSFDNKSILIRNAASQDIVAFLGVLEPKNWPQCLNDLFVALDAPDLDRQEVSLFSILFWRYPISGARGNSPPGHVFATFSPSFTKSNAVDSYC